MNLSRYASPARFYPLGGRLIPWFAVPATILFAVGLFVGFFIAPTDAQQGDAYRIMFIHVPAAWMGMFLYVLMAIYAGLVDDGLRTRDHRCVVHRDFARYRRVLGQTDVGHVVGVGRAYDVDTDSAISLRRFYFTASRHR